MLELNKGEWEWVIAALEHFQDCPQFVWDKGENAEMTTLLHKIQDANVWGGE